MKVVKLIFLSVMSFISIFSKGQSNNDIFYNAEILDHVFFEQLDSIVKKQTKEKSKYMVYICDEKNRNINYTLQSQDSVIYLMVKSFETILFKDYYRVRYKRNEYYVYKGAENILIKKGKKIKVPKNRDISIRDLIGPYWLIEYKNSQMRVRYYGTEDDIGESDLS